MTELWLAIIVLAGLLVQTMTGFGFNVIAVTLGALFLPIKVWLPVVVTLNLPMAGWIAWRHRHHISWPLLLRHILPLMLVGGAVGLGLALALSGDVLKRVFGVLVVVLAGRELWRLGRADHGAAPATAAYPARVWVLLAGLLQGLYASGGPPLVYALSKVAIDRAVFRATLMTLWFTLNSCLVVAYASSGLWTTDTAVRCAWLLPLVPLGIVVGDWLHHRVSDRGFSVAVQLVLLIAGLALVVR